MITASFRVSARTGIGPSHRRRLALEVLGFGALVDDQFVLEEEKGVQLFGFRCAGGKTQLEVEKFFSMVNT